jgi:ABC-2 type transport system permease protein
VAVCFVFAVASYPLVTDFIGSHSPMLSDIARRVGVLDRFQDFTRGVVSLPDVIYFASFIVFFLFLNTVILEQRRAD